MVLKMVLKWFSKSIKDRGEFSIKNEQYYLKMGENKSNWAKLINNNLN